MINYLARVFASAIVRRIAFLLVAAAIAWLGIGKANAQAPTNSCPSSGSCTEAQAYASCMTAMNFAWNGMTQAQRNTWGGSRCNRNPTPKYYRCEIGSTANGWYGCDSSNVQGFSSSLNIHYWFSGTCPNGINPASGQCSLTCPGGYTEDPFTPGQCLDAGKCTARNSQPGFLNVGNIPTGDTDRCVSGCRYKAVNGSVCTTLNGVKHCSADMDFNGDPCASQPVQPMQEAAEEADDKQKCGALGTQTVCVKPDGQHCYSGPIGAGKQFCWQPRQTGEKNDANARQKRDAGNQAVAPNLQLPSGDSLFQNGTPVTTTTTITDSTGGTASVTTTVTNYTTTNGTNASGGNDPGDGEPTDGSGDDSEAGASGGGDCDTPPIVSGDAALNMVATQTWATRCAVEAGNAANATGDISDCNAQFSVEGNTANALKLRAMRKQICPGEVEMPSLNPSDYLGDGTGEPTAEQVTSEVGDTGFDGWDRSGFGFGSACPALPSVTIYGRTYDLGGSGRGDAACDMANILGWFVIFLASLACIRIVTEA